jgi:hypothetical protein
MLLVRQLRLFEHDVDFLHVRAGQRIKVDHDNVLGWSLKENGKALKLPAQPRAGKAVTFVSVRHALTCARSAKPRRFGL